MESQNKVKKILDNKYTILKKLDKGNFANVYLVKENDTEKIYAAKILLNKESNFFKREKKFLGKLQNVNCPYIVKMINSSTGKIEKGNKLTVNKQYIILEYAEKGNLFNYIFYTNKGFGERLGKLIFHKILKGFKACHDANICHKDIKMENILLDKNFEPKIADFGFANIIKTKKSNTPLTERFGNEYYMAPEIVNYTRPYNGAKADIYSLGVLLIYLITGKNFFAHAQRKDPIYRLTMDDKIEDFLNLIEENISGLSQELKNLYIKMISDKPKLRPDINYILDKDEFLKEIRDLTEEEYKNLNEELYEEFKKRQLIVEEKLKYKNDENENEDEDESFEEIESENESDKESENENQSDYVHADNIFSLIFKFLFSD